MNGNHVLIEEDSMVVEDLTIDSRKNQFVLFGILKHSFQSSYSCHHLK